MSLRRVNKLALDGTNVSLVIGTSVLRVTKQSYGDSLTIAKGSALGSQEQDYQTSGSYKTDDCSYTVESIDYRNFLSTLPANGFGNKIFSAVILYEHPAMGSDSDLLDGFRFLTNAVSVEAGEKMIEQEIKASCMQIYWGERRATLNFVKGKPRAQGIFF